MAHEIKKVYGMEAEVIYPPVEIPQTSSSMEPREDYYLSVSRLISHKRVDLSVQACTRLGKNLIVVGDGPEKEKLAQLAGKTIRFVGRVSDEELQDLYRRGKGLLFPSYEDYGIVPLEAQAWGVPVIAFGRGGSLETIKGSVSGIFFEQQEVDSLVEAISRFESTKFDMEMIRQWVAGFNVASFTAQIRKFVEQS